MSAFWSPIIWLEDQLTLARFILNPEKIDSSSFSIIIKINYKKSKKWAFLSARRFVPVPRYFFNPSFNLFSSLVNKLFFIFRFFHFFISVCKSFSRCEIRVQRLLFNMSKLFDVKISSQKNVYWINLMIFYWNSLRILTWPFCSWSGPKWVQTFSSNFSKSS